MHMQSDGCGDLGRPRPGLVQLRLLGAAILRQLYPLQSNDNDGEGDWPVILLFRNDNIKACIKALEVMRFFVTLLCRCVSERVENKLTWTRDCKIMQRPILLSVIIYS